MVLGAKASPAGRISIMKIQKFTVEKRKSVIRLVYGALLMLIGITVIIIKPMDIVTNWMMEMREGSFLYKIYENPPYQLYSDVYVYNYTNVDRYLDGRDNFLKLEEIGPFKFQETRTNRNITVDPERGLMSFIPNTDLTFLPQESIGHYKDIQVFVPNIALIAISTLAADKLGYFANVGAYLSIQSLGSKLFVNLTAEELLWGYRDPVVTVANTILPGWIDFGKIGILDRFYAKKQETADVELRNISTKFSIHNWNGSPGLAEQGFTDLNSSTPCNTVRGSYEGLMVAPKVTKDRVIPIYRRQACRVYPFVFEKEIRGDHGFNFYRFQLQDSSFNTSSKYACKCKDHCLPDGFIDVSECYYSFPIALSKPHFLDVDPVQKSYFVGMKPDPEKHSSQIDLEPNLGVPLALSTKIQVNVAVRMNAGNPITKPLKDKIVPLVWLALYCKEPPPEVVTLLRMRFVIAPPLLITLEVTLLLIGILLGAQGFHRIWKPKYRLIQSDDEEARNQKSNVERKLSTVLLNVADKIIMKDDHELAKQAVSLLAIREENNNIGIDNQCHELSTSDEDSTS